MIHIKNNPEMGRGIYASKNIPENTIIERSELLVLDSKDTTIVNSTNLKYYTFKYNETQDCLVLGIGEIFNHSDNPNISYNLINIGDRYVMEFKTIRKINVGEQLFINYNADTIINSEDYLKNKSLIT